MNVSDEYNKLAAENKRKKLAQKQAASCSAIGIVWFVICGIGLLSFLYWVSVTNFPF